MAHVEMVLQSPRVKSTYEEPTLNLEALDNLEEKRLNALITMVNYRNKMSSYYNKRVHPQKFQGDLVMTRIDASQSREGRGKLGKNWEGPFKIVQVLPQGS